MSTTTIAALLERNKATSANHTPLPTIAELQALNAPMPTTVVVTCMDPRCIPENFLNLQPGEVVVVRNGGGNIRFALRDITIIDQLFGVQELLIIHHTDCGTLLWTEEQMREGVKGVVAREFWGEVEGMEFGANVDIVESVKGDLQWVKGHPLIRDKVKEGCQGFVYDIKTGKLERVEV